MFLSKTFETVQIRSLVDLNKQSARKNYKLDDEFEYIDISSIDNIPENVIDTIHKQKNNNIKSRKKF